MAFAAALRRYVLSGEHQVRASQGPPGLRRVSKIGMLCSPTCASLVVLWRGPWCLFSKEMLHLEGHGACVEVSH